MRNWLTLLILLAATALNAQDFAVFSDSIFEGYPYFQSAADNTTGIFGPTLGPVSNWRGTWVSGTSYSIADGVIDAGLYYNCTSATSGTTHPASDSSHWQNIDIWAHDVGKWAYLNSGGRYTGTNYGFEGKTSDGVYSLLVLQYIENFPGRFVVIEGGENDVSTGGSYANFINSMQVILDRCQQLNKYMLVADLGPDNGFSSAQNTTITNWNVGLRAWAATNSCVTVMPFHLWDADPSNWNHVNPPYLAGTPHLTSLGTSNVASLIVYSMDQLVGPIIPSYRVPAGGTNWLIAGVDGGIPAHSSITTNTTLNPGATAAQINAAIAACPSNQCVVLNPGTYNLSSYIIWPDLAAGQGNGVVLRGCGPTNTFIVYTNSTFGSGAATIELHGFDRWGNGYPDDTVSNVTGATYVRLWQSGYAQGSSNITINLPGTNSATHSSLFTNIIIVLDQENDTWVNMQGSDGYFASGLRENGNRAQQQYVRVTGIYQNTNLTIWPPVYATNWQASLKPCIWWWGTSLQMAGVEDLAVSGTQDAQNIILWACDNCWVKNVQFLKPSKSVYMYNAKNCTVTGCYVNDSRTYGSGSYGMTGDVSGDPLIENNAFNLVTTPLTFDSTCGGVYCYNFCTNNVYNSTNDPQIAASIQPHAGGSTFHLYEGNWGTAFVSDFIHGSQRWHTGYRNRFMGPERATNVAYCWPIYFNASNWDMTVEGNVLGTIGFHTNYEVSVPTLTNIPTGNLMRSIYSFGFWADTQAPSDNTKGDANVAISVLRHGNWDADTQTIIYDANTPQHTLQPSLFWINGTKPAEFITGYPYPPFDPALSSTALPTNLPAYQVYLNGGGSPGPPPPPPVIPIYNFYSLTVGHLKN